MDIKLIDKISQILYSQHALKPFIFSFIFSIFFTHPHHLHASTDEHRGCKTLLTRAETSNLVSIKNISLIDLPPSIATQGLTDIRSNRQTTSLMPLESAVLIQNIFGCSGLIIINRKLNLQYAAHITPISTSEDDLLQALMHIQKQVNGFFEYAEIYIMPGSAFFITKDFLPFALDLAYGSINIDQHSDHPLLGNTLSLTLKTIAQYDKTKHLKPTLFMPVTSDESSNKVVAQNGNFFYPTAKSLKANIVFHFRPEVSSLTAGSY